MNWFRKIHARFRARRCNREAEEIMEEITYHRVAAHRHKQAAKFLFRNWMRARNNSRQDRRYVSQKTEKLRWQKVKLKYAQVKNSDG